MLKGVFLLINNKAVGPTIKAVGLNSGSQQFSFDAVVGQTVECLV
jgi:hypothetical protein